MDFIDQIKQFADRVQAIKDSIQTEEATKTSVIMPFFAMLGYDVFNPNEFTPEYIADVGIKKGEKIDYAIIFDGVPSILIEAKSINENLTKHSSQLFRYFGTSSAKFAILTNGIIYQFFTDLEDINKMDEKPFLEINIFDVKDFQIPELKRFTKSAFNAEEIASVASDLKYSYEFKNMFAEELSAPSDEFVKHFLSKTYQGVKTQSILDRYRDVLKRSLNAYITELMNDKIKNALGTQVDYEEQSPPEVVEVDGEEESKIVTTPQELEAYYLVKMALSDVVDYNDISYKDNERYMSINYKNKTTKCICRLFFNSDKNKFITIPDENKKHERFDISEIYDIKQYTDKLETALRRYL